MKKTTVRAKTTPKSYRPPDAVSFPPARGKTLLDLYLNTDPDFTSITLTFDDNTEIVLEIEPFLIFHVDYSDWKTGNQRVLKRWPRIRSR